MGKNTEACELLLSKRRDLRGRVITSSYRMRGHTIRYHAGQARWVRRVLRERDIWGTVNYVVSRGILTEEEAAEIYAAREATGASWVERRPEWREVLAVRGVTVLS